jgi:1-deoxy-D-xylulose-5-phosphate synthase
MFTLEDHVAAGGFGAAALELASGRADLDANRVEVLALPDRFIDHGQRGEQLADAGLDLDHVVERVTTRLAALRPGAPVRLVTGS